MLQYFRSGGFGRILVGGVVGAIILVFVVEFRQGRGPTATSLQEICAVKHDGHCVDRKEYEAAYRLVAPRGLEPKAAKSFELHRRVLDGLVERELLAAEAQRQGLGIAEKEVDDELSLGRAHVSLPADGLQQTSSQLGLCRLNERGAGCEPNTAYPVRQLRVRRTASGAFDYDMYERDVRVLTNRGPREFKEMQSRELLADRMRVLVRSRVRVAQEEVAFAAETLTVRSAVLNGDWFARFAVDTSDAALDRWAFDHRSEVDAAWETEKANWKADCPIVREIAVELPPVASDTSNPSRERLQRARERIVAGEDFAAVAREIGTSASATLGGELGCLTESYGPGSDVLLGVVAKLAPGALSEVVETEHAAHLLKLEARLSADKLEEVGRRHVARRLYLRSAGQAMAKTVAERLIERSKAGDKLEELVVAESRRVLEAAPGKTKPKAEDLDSSPALLDAGRPRFDVSAPVGRGGNPLPGVQAREPLSALAFALEKPDAVHDKPIETLDGFVVLQLKERGASEEMAERRAMAAQGLREAKAEEALTRYVADLRRAAGDSLKIDSSFGEAPAQSSGM